MSINFSSSDEFLSHFNTLNSVKKQELLRQVLNSNQLDLVKAVIKEKNSHTIENRSLALRASIETGKIDLAIAIIGKDLSNSEREEDLQLAFEKGQIKTVAALLKSGPVSGHVLEVLLKKAVTDQNLPMLKALLSYSDFYYEYKIAAAIEACDMEDLVAINEIFSPHNFSTWISSFVGLDGQSIELGGKVLEHACQKGQLPVVLELIKKKFIDFRLNEGFRAAAKNGHIEIVRELLKKNSVFSANYPYRLNIKEGIKIAAKNGHLEVVRLLLAHDSLDELGLGFLLEEVAKAGHTELVRLLFGSGPTKDLYQQLALEIAALNGHTETVDFFLHAVPNIEKSSALSKAASSGHLNTVQTILAADPNIDKSWALQSAAFTGHLNILQTILASGPIPVEHIYWALRTAAEYGRLPIVQAIIAAGPIPQHVLAYAYDIAREHGRGEVRVFLHQALAQNVEAQAPNAAAAINPSQSTHTASVHKSVSESASRLYSKYGHQIVGRVDELVGELRKEIEASSNPQALEALRAIDRIMHPEFIFQDQVSQISIQQLIALAIVSNCPLDSIIQGLYESQREYNFDESGHDLGGADSAACAAGTFNKIMQSMQLGGVEEAQIVYITKQTASLKLKACVKSFCQKNGIKEITDENLEGIKKGVYEEMLPYKTVFNSEKEFEEFLNSSQWIDLS